jgi:predicted RNA-binding protein with PIN domain
VAELIVDGYNLTGLLRGDLERERQRLVEAMAAYRKQKGHDITVVFDGWKDGSGHESRSTEGGVNVVFTGLGEKADTVIIKTISKSQTPMIVVSSDREIQKHAWSHGSTPIDSEVFLSVIERDDGIKGPGEGVDYQQRGKGNPRRPSKKQKAINRALAKL